MILPLLTLLGACGDPPRPEPVPPAEATAVALSVDVPFAELSVPEDNRPEGRDPTERIPLRELRLIGVSDGLQSWAAPLPVRLRGLFFHAPPEGMALLDARGEPVPHHARERRGLHWTYDAQQVQVHAPQDHPIAKERFELSWPLAAEREARLNRRTSDHAEPEDFVRTTIQDGPTSRAGLLLPAPGVAAWDVRIPRAAELHFAPGLVRPETLDGPLSDGYELVVEIEQAGQATPVHRETIGYDDFAPRRLDLSSWAGRDVRLRFRTLPGGSSTFDYAFLGDPQLVSRQRDPKRVILVFVDTLRPDHLGVYGYHRDTSPTLDALAEDAVVFEQARSVAPWTLPTSRTLVTGRQPEVYDQVETIQHRLRQEGWATAMLAGNVYLSSNFGAARDWATHHVVNWPSATEQVDHALAWLEAQEGRDAFLLLHLMDPHLPYQEPPEYRFLFAGRASPALGQTFHRSAVLRRPLTEADRAFVVDRYDNNIRYANDELGRLFDTLGEEDVLVYLSDHGEEFWEHGGFEHGHTLYDEVLRVPLIVRAPGIAHRRVAEPVSLLDVVPTLYDLVGVEAGPFDGTSLLPAMEGDDDALEALATRTTAFGRPLYGDTRWGALQGTSKYKTTAGVERAFDLGEDPEEQVDLLRRADADPSPYRSLLAEGLGTPVALGLRLTALPSSEHPEGDLTVTLRLPGGAAAAWVGDDPTSRSSAAVEITGEEVHATWHGGFPGTREVFVQPSLPLAEALAEAGAIATYGEDTATLSLSTEARGPRIARGAVGSRHVEVTRAVLPDPLEQAIALDGYDPELASMLQAMGYAVGEEAPAPEGDDEDP